MFLLYSVLTLPFFQDGFPRTLKQAQALDAMLAQEGACVTKVVELQVPDSVLEERICGRWIHKKSGRSYHVKYAPPKSMKKDKDGKPIESTMIDDETGEALMQVRLTWGVLEACWKPIGLFIFVNVLFFREKMTLLLPSSSACKATTTKLFPFWTTINQTALSGLLTPIKRWMESGAKFWLRSSAGASRDASCVTFTTTVAGFS